MALTVQAGEAVTLTTTAPLYPTMSYTYEPTVYTYTHSFYASGTWMEPGELTVTVNTPYYRINGLDEYEKTEMGYTQTVKRLPGERLSFSLSTVESPSKREESATVETEFVFPFRLFAPVAAIAGVLLLIFIIEAVVHRIRERREN